MKGWTRRSRRNWPVEKIWIIGVAAERRTIDGEILDRLDKRKERSSKGKTRMGTVSLKVNGCHLANSRHLDFSSSTSLLPLLCIIIVVVEVQSISSCWESWRTAAATAIITDECVDNLTSRCCRGWWAMQLKKYLSTLQVIARNFAILCEPFYYYLLWAQLSRINLPREKEHEGMCALFTN